MGSQDSLVVRVPDSWSIGCEYEYWQKQQENLLLQSQLCVLTCGIPVLDRKKGKNTIHPVISSSLIYCHNTCHSIAEDNMEKMKLNETRRQKLGRIPGSRWAYKAIFWCAPCFKEITFKSSWFSVVGALICVPTVPHCGAVSTKIMKSWNRLWRAEFKGQDDEGAKKKEKKPQQQQQRIHICELRKREQKWKGLHSRRVQ